MTPRSYLLLVSFAALACTPEPVQNPDDVSGQPLSHAQPGPPAPQQAATQVTPASESTKTDQGPPSGNAAPTPATSTVPDGAGLPSSTQPKAGAAAPPPNVPNSMPQPDAL